MSKENKNSKKQDENKAKKKTTKTANTKETKVTKKQEPKKKEVIEEIVEDEEIIEEEFDETEEDFIEEEDFEEIDNEIIEDEDEIIDETEEDFIEEEIIEEKKSTKKKERNKKEKKEKASKEKAPKEKNSKEKIEKIEKIAKEKNKSSKHTKNSSNFTNFLAYLEKNRFPIYGFIAGMLLTILVVIIIWPDRIATLKDGTQNVATIKGHNYTANDLYENMKDYYSISLLLDQIDTDLLTELYEEDDEMTQEVKSNAEYYLNMYEQYYGYTEEQFLSENGFSSYEEFLEYLRLDYRRNAYLDDYIEKNIKDKEIETYYNENVIGDINCQHVLVEVSSSDDDGKLSDEDAKALAEEIIDKLNDGTSWETIQEDYKDKITFEDLGYQSWDANLEESFMTALKDLEDNSYSTEPVKTSYGYHVIYRLDQKEAPKLEDVKEDIIETIITDKKSEDSNLLYKSLIELRKENEIEFSDTVLGSKYDAYVKKYN